MSPAECQEIRADIRELRDDADKMQRDIGKRLGKLEGRVFEIEIWRARLQGAAGASKVVWMIAGGAVTAFIIELIRNL